MRKRSKEAWYKQSDEGGCGVRNKIWAVCRVQLSIRAREAGAGRSTPSDRHGERGAEKKGGGRFAAGKNNS